MEFSKLTRVSILKSLIKMRNRQVTRGKLKSENIFRKINERKKEVDNQINKILKKGNVINSNRNITLDDIKNKKISGEFTIYHVIKNKLSPVVDKYESSLNINENKRDEIFLDFWEEIEKYKGEVAIKFKQKTFNNVDSGTEPIGESKNLYY